MAIAPPDIKLDSPAFLSVETPFEQQALFANPAPLAVEVGCGNGHFLTGLAASSPEKNYIGIDIRYKRIEKSCSKADRAGLSNLRFILDDAYKVLEEYFPEGSLSAVYVNFPDPWPKFKHRKFRLNRMLFIRLMSKSLESGGDLWWVCDHYPQIVSVVSLCRELEKEGLLKNCHGIEGFSLEEPEYPPTLYEKRWRSEGRPIFYIRFKRTSKKFPAETGKGG